MDELTNKAIKPMAMTNNKAKRFLYKILRSVSKPKPEIR